MDNGSEIPFDSQVVDESKFCHTGLDTNTTYKWQVADCTGLNGTGCSLWGPKWEFKTDGGAFVDPPEITNPLLYNKRFKFPINLFWPDPEYGLYYGEDIKSYYLEIRDTDDQLVFVDVVPDDTEDTIYTTVDSCFMTKDATYKFRVASCLNANGTRCGDNCCDSQSGASCAEYYFRPLSHIEYVGFYSEKDLTIDPPNLEWPRYTPPPNESIPEVNILSGYLEWENACHATFYNLQIFGNVANIVTSTAKVKLTNFIKKLQTNTTYAWRVRSCWGPTDDDCEDTWSPRWKFKTSGGVPILTSPTVWENNVLIPTTLTWEGADTFLSYIYEVRTGPAFGSKTVATGTTLVLRTVINHPNVTSSRAYYWRVKGCIDTAGTVCGNYSLPRPFNTVNLVSPCTSPPIKSDCISPADGDDLSTAGRTITWDPVLGANFYQYQMQYDSKSAEETNPNCVPGSLVIPGDVVSSNSAFLLSLGCLGVYSWRVESCIDRDCKDGTGLKNSPEWSFNFTQQFPPGSFGLVPCNRFSDDLSTPWNERDSCEFEDIFILMKNIIDFILWRLSFIVLVLLIIATAVIYYFSLGTPGTIVKVKSLWSTTLKGYAIMLLVWLIISLMVAALGYRVELFGSWWILDFVQ
jgi:hypothetical protein